MMGRVKEQLLDMELINEVFGSMHKYIISTDKDDLNVGDYVCLVNSNCEFEFDNVAGCFEDNLLHYFICDLEPRDLDLSNYDRSKSNNGGAYAYLTCKVKKVYNKTY